MMIGAELRSTTNSCSNFREAIEIPLKVCAKRLNQVWTIQLPQIHPEGSLNTTATVCFTMIGHT